MLIIDDEVNIVATNRRMLEKHGYRVLTANNGQQALEVYKLNRPDVELVVTDIMMPSLDGMGLIRALRATNPEIKIIASSGLGSGLGSVSGGDNRASELNDLGVNAFLAKPYPAEKLLRLINECAQRKTPSRWARPDAATSGCSSRRSRRRPRNASNSITTPNTSITTPQIRLMLMSSERS